ncbi:negative cofactor 2 transcription regulator complex subunit ncb2 [Chytriomyces hyalinus]|nr:negative cofactor 2 transcription regulator complex subunit ncb2 [Chytriomyces hyalinus]KAJ3261846.1 negative cofactor 2 transcription regulator complex subunit ncb2 [Chytriomyces hyalinus]
MSDDEEDYPTAGAGLDDEEVGLPKTTIAKIIQEVLPNDLWCAKETRDLITDCCLEFVHLISSEANEECEKESKKTITGEHVLAALRSLGFEDYITEVNGALDDHNKLSKERRKRSTKFDNSGISAEEKLRRQEALIEQARLNMMNGMTGEPN